MIAYKGFNKDLTCTKGKGVFQYEPGKKYVEEKAKCARTGFHAATNPLDVLSYCLLYTSPSPRDGLLSRMPSSA